MKRISFDDLQQAELNGLIRLAKWLKVFPNRYDKETDKQYRQRIIMAIARIEKKLSKAPREIKSLYRPHIKHVGKS